tara:strand:- start:1543 stop:1692 length:150 start_codon:yes stop_codon:yes gene_type:complete
MRKLTPLELFLVDLEEVNPGISGHDVVAETLKAEPYMVEVLSNDYIYAS